MIDAKRMIAPLLLLAGCAHAPLRIGSVDVDAWADAQPAPGVSRTLAQRYELIRPQLATLAKQKSINLVLDEAMILYAAPDLDLTPTLLGHPGGAARGGERLAVIALQRVIETTRDGKQARAALKVEFEHKQAELDQRQEELKARYGHNIEAARQSAEMAALVQRLRALQRELKAHEDDAVRAIIARMKPDIAELARRRGIDIVFEATNKGEEVVYRGNVAYPSPRGPDLTDELIRLHDERTP